MNLMKSIFAAVLALFTIFSAPAFALDFAPPAPTADQIQQYVEWSGVYGRLGIYLTSAEILAKCKSLNMEKAAAGLENDLREPFKNLVDQNNAKRAMYEKFSKQAMQSKSKTTRFFAKREMKLLDDVRTEQKRRDVDGFVKTEADLTNTFDLIAKRVDTETTLEGIRKILSDAAGKGSPSELAEEKEIRSLLKTFELEEERPDFTPEPRLTEFVNRFNRYTSSVNATTNAPGFVQQMQPQNNNKLD